MEFIKSFFSGDFWNQPLNSNWVLFIASAFLLVFLYIAYRQNPKNYKFKLNLKRVKLADIEKVLNTFKNLGLNLNRGISTADLIEGFYQNGTFYSVEEFLFFAFGNEIQKNGDWLRVCDSCLYFDFECITDTDDYLNIFNDFVRLIPENNKLAIDAKIINEQFKFSIGTYQKELDIKTNSDWADEDIIENFFLAVEKNLPQGLKIHAIAEGQGEFFVVMSEENFTKLLALLK